MVTTTAPRGMFGKLWVRAWSPGSPLRYLRKASLYATSPVAYLARRGGIGEIRPSENFPMASLERDGLGVVATPDSSPLFQELCAAVEGLRHRESGVINRKYFGELLDPQQLDRESIFFRYAMQEKYLGGVSRYLGQVPVLAELSVLVSRLSTEGKWEESQLWHKDYDDSRMVKLFVYLNDVQIPEDGPFTYIPAEFSGQISDGFIPRRINDKEMENQGGAANAQRVIGAKGTTFFVDTARCFHMGSRCLRQERVAFVATFTTMAPLFPRKAGFRGIKASSWLETMLLAENAEEKK